MLSIKRLSFLLLICCFCSISKAQVRTKIFISSFDTLTLDTLSIVPGTVQVLVNGSLLPDSLFQLDAATAKISFNKIISDTVVVKYRAFPFSLTKQLSHKNANLVRTSADGPADIFVYKPSAQTVDIFKSNELQKNGSISRGISFGNNQDVVVNSNLDLRMSGRLTDKINIAMAATDNNIPVQPDGNTQQLQDFDKVFIELYDDKSKLIAGDYTVNRPRSYFMNYNKRAQGLYFNTALMQGDKKNVKNNIKIGGAVSRGKYNKQLIIGVEGNQGPYRLRGAEGEPFIIILSGTELVYIDGELLKRGQDNDYVIDYNNAEITFTAKRLITKDKRITIEFQYSDRNYARSLFFAGNEYTFDKGSFGVNLYSEQDSKNQPLQQQLSNDDKILLRSIGDTISKALVPSVDSVAFSGAEVLYSKHDTTVASVLYKDIYEYSSDATNAFYRVRFSNVGPGNGNYIQIQSSANGKVYQWVAPISGVKQGLYEPVIQIATPKQRQMAVVNGEYLIANGQKLHLEGAISKNDINTYSKFNSNDDDGFAIKAGYDLQKSLGKKDSIMMVTASLQYEFVDKYFSPIERFRTIEFERDWNRLNFPQINDQHIATVILGIKKGDRYNLGYTFNSFNESGVYDGYKNGILFKYFFKGLNVNATASYLNASSNASNTLFLRHNVTVSQTVKGITLGLTELQERNSVSKKYSDTLLLNSFDFFEWETFLKNSDTAKLHMGVSYKQRNDYLPKTDILARATYAENIAFNLALFKSFSNNIAFTVTKRYLSIIDTLLTPQKKDNTLLGRLEYNLKFWKGFLSASTFYEIGSGLEARKEFYYLEVAPGQGQYAWIDYNSNGVRELNEFEISIYKDQAKFIRVFVPSANYIKVYSNQFSQLIDIKPSALWSGKKKFKGLVARFNNQFAWRVERKTTTGDLVTAYNPFVDIYADSLMVSLASSVRNTVFFNQLSPVWGIDHTWQENRSRSLLQNGLDERVSSNHEIKARWNVTRKIILQAKYLVGSKESYSQFFATRNFDISYYSIEPRLSFQPGTSFRASISARYSEKFNKPELGDQYAELMDYGLELRYNVVQKGSLNIKTNYINIKYSGITGSSIAFEMLEALSIGDNITWGASYQQNLSNNMQISVGYEGRKTQTTKTIHTGSAQVRAFF